MDDAQGHVVLHDLFGLRAAQHELAWQPLRPGIEACWLYREEPDGRRAALLRYAPGARVPEHRHAGGEHIFILSGSQRDARGVYTEGTVIFNPPGSRHAVVSDDGCLVLVLWEKAVQFIPETP